MPQQEVLIVLFPSLVAALCLVILGVMLLARRGFVPPLEERVPAGAAVAVVAASLSFAAAALHNVRIGEHLAADPLLGAGFAAMTVFQVGWGVLFLAVPTTAVAALGLIGNDLIVLLWAWSRTGGLPTAGGPTPQGIGVQEATTTLIELVLIVLLAARLAPQLRPWMLRQVRFGDAAIVTAFAVVLVAVVTGVSLTTPTTGV